MSRIFITLSCAKCGSENVRARNGTRRIDQKQSVRYCRCLQCGHKEKFTVLSGAHYRITKYEERAGD